MMTRLSDACVGRPNLRQGHFGWDALNQSATSGSTPVVYTSGQRAKGLCQELNGFALSIYVGVNEDAQNFLLVKDLPILTVLPSLDLH